MATLLGFDFGTHRIGVAVGQTVTHEARPLTTLYSRDGRPDWDSVAKLVSEWHPEAFILGLPIDLDGQEVDWSARVHRFARQLHGRFGRRVHLIDERFTSIEAQHRRQARGTQGPGPAETVDAMAAAVILETWLREQEAS